MDDHKEMIFCYIDAARKALGPEGMRELADDLEYAANDLRMDAYEKEQQRGDDEDAIADRAEGIQ